MHFFKGLANSILTYVPNMIHICPNQKKKKKSWNYRLINEKGGEKQKQKQKTRLCILRALALGHVKWHKGQILPIQPQ